MEFCVFALDSQSSYMVDMLMEVIHWQFDHSG